MRSSRCFRNRNYKAPLTNRIVEKREEQRMLAKIGKFPCAPSLVPHGGDVFGKGDNTGSRWQLSYMTDGGTSGVFLQIMVSGVRGALFALDKLQLSVSYFRHFFVSRLLCGWTWHGERDCSNRKCPKNSTKKVVSRISQKWKRKRVSFLLRSDEQFLRKCVRRAASQNCPLSNLVEKIGTGQGTRRFRGLFCAARKHNF